MVVFADGGWDLTFTFDPKPGRPDVAGPYGDLDPQDPQDVEVVRSFGDIDVTTNEARRPWVTRYFERWGHVTSVVRGLWVGSVSHWIGQRRILSGVDDPTAPDIAALVGAIHGRSRPLGAVDLSNIGRFGGLSRMTARGGVRGQLGQLLRPELRYPTRRNKGRPSLRLRPSEREALDDWLAEVGEREADVRGVDVGRVEAMAHRLEARQRAERLRQQGSSLVVPAPGGQTATGLAAFAASLLATESCAAVMVDSGGLWDTHTDHRLQHGYHDRLFMGLGGLLEALEEASILGDTLVVAMSEMMRSPWRNADGGTEHWPYTGLLLAGAGVAGGRVCGATDDRLVGRPADPESGDVVPTGSLLSYEHAIAGVLEHVGIDRHPGPRLRGWSL